MSNKKSTYFEPVDTKVNFPEMEKKLVDHWYQSGVVDKYLKKNNKSKKSFSFMDGPITANNPMGVHHGWGRTYKDLWQRYKNMQGYKQRFQNGFDSQGLWVEVEVEKALGFNSKKDIEDYGIAKFVQKCKDRVKKYSDIQTEQSKRLGYFMDWDNSFYTMSDENNYMIWHFLKVCDDHGWLFKGKESVPWCPRCETAISQHEILTEDYKELTHKSIILELPIVGRDKEFLLVWTTTPWTLPANIAVAIDKKIDYSLVSGNLGDKYWLATETIKRVFGNKPKIFKTVKGEKLVGLKYSAAFDHLPAVKEVADKNPDTFHTVVPTDDRIMPISTEEGTGMVHTAVSAGTEDYKLGKKLGLPMIPVIADNADYFEGFGEFSGKNAKNHPEIILDYLVAEDKKPGIDWVFEIIDYKHRYPVCWRCKEELVWKVTDEWYIGMDRISRKATSGKQSSSKDSDTLRKRMIKIAKEIEWIPEFGLKRELDWLNNMQDWLISKKNRFWGLCLPIWECNDCMNFEVIGSKDELKKRAVSGWANFEGKTPHKPQIDDIKIKCNKCGSMSTRIEPVGNPWLDAGILSFSTITKDNKGKPLYTSDHKEWEKWFPADFITESFPGQFKNWFYAMIAMSAVLENKKPYNTVLGFATLLGEDGKAMHKTLGNAIDFNEGADKIGVDVMRWMYTKQNYNDNLLFGYKAADEIRRRFLLKLWNIYNYYVTYANLDGFKPKQISIKESNNILDKWILARLNKTVIDVSKYLDNYNAYRSNEVLESFVDDLSNWYIRRSRERVGITVDDSEDKTSFYLTLDKTLIDLSKLLAPFVPYVSDTIYTNITKEESVHLSSWPTPLKLSKTETALVKDMELVRSIVEKGHSERKLLSIPVRQPLLSIKVVCSESKPTSNLLKLIEDELNVKKVVWAKGAKLEVTLNKKITKELAEEAKARELVRNIQKERRRMEIELTQEIRVVSNWLPENEELLDEIKRKTLAKSIIKGKKLIVTS